MTLVDTPDYQRGIVNAQKLLADVTVVSDTVTVGVPPNCETLVAVCTNEGAGISATCVGVTSGITYPGVRVAAQGALYTTVEYAFDASNVIDDQVTITWSATPVTGWYVYSDAGVHVVVDIGNNRDRNGSLFTVPTIPYGQPGSHPPQEVSHYNSVLSASGAVLAAPGVGERYRVFAGSLTNYAATMVTVLYDVGASKSFLGCAGMNTSNLVLPSQGLPISSDSAIDFGINAGAGNCEVVLFYTLETV